ncbi:MAG TPA: lamin tail domain-containing protein [Minicystis sp.]|nr:lamin tail domain-containing protein [Minicystis sp.]
MRAFVLPALAALALGVNLAGCAGESAPEDLGVADEALLTGSSAAAYVMISEFRAGPPTGANPGFVELYNAGASAADVSGWAVDDIASGGASPHALAAGTTIPARGRLVVHFAGVNRTSADRVRLLDASGHEVDGQTNFYAGSSTYGQCFGRDDETLAWSMHPTPSCTPGAANGQLTDIDPPLAINEFKPGTGGFVEIVNRGGAPQDVSGYRVDDIGGGASPKAIPAGTVLQPGAVVAISFTGVNTSSHDLVRLLDPAGNEIERHDNRYSGSSNTGKCFGRVPDGGPWSAAAIPCTRGHSNGTGGASPLSPFALQAIGSFTAPSGPVTALVMREDGTYTATVEGAVESGTFTADATVKAYPLTYVFDGGGHRPAWHATIEDWQHALHVAVLDASGTLTGYPDSEAQCDDSGGSWTDDDADAATGLFCICTAPKVLIWSAGGCTL